MEIWLRSRRRVTGTVILIILGGTGSALVFSGIAHPARFFYAVRGIDVSHHNGTIDWNAVAGDGVRFAWIKATEGSDHRDTRFLANWHSAVEAGVVVGAYHVFTTCSPGGDQALNFSSAVPKTEGALPPAIDISSSGCGNVDRPDSAALELEILLRSFRDSYGKDPVIFVNGEVRVPLDKIRKSSSCWQQRFLLPPSEKHCRFWQYSLFGRVSGITGNVDLNVFRGSDEEFRHFVATSDGIR